MICIIFCTLLIGTISVNANNVEIIRESNDPQIANMGDPVPTIMCVEGPKTVGILQPGEIQEIKLKNFKFPKSHTSHYFRAEGEYLNCERTDINNEGDGYVTP